LKKDKTIRILFISGTVFIAIFFIVMVINTYDYILNDAKKNHQMQQMEMAKAAASGIGSYLSGLTDDMRFLSDYPGVKELDKKVIKTNADLLLDHYNNKIVKTIFVLDSIGRPVYYTGTNPPASLYYGPEFEIKSLRNDVPRYFKIEPFYGNNVKSGLIFVMLMPFGEERKDLGAGNVGKRIVENSNIGKGGNGGSKLMAGGKRSEIISDGIDRKENGIGEKIDKGKGGRSNGGKGVMREGYIGFIVSFDSLVHKYIVPLKLGEKDFAWIIDGGGRLIYHPTHRDMLLRSITKTSSNCLKCHNSFGVQEKMIRGNSSFDEYTIGNEPPKIMAYVPIILNGDKWILAISTFLPEVTANLRDKFALFFGLGVLILFVIISLGALLYFQTVRKVRAEESNRHMEQRQNFLDQLSQAAKLASIGELVDSVAHEINTPLGIISSHIDALKLQKDYPMKFSEDLEVIKNQTKRINNYTKSLLNYSHRIPFNPKPEKLTVLIDECLFLLNPLFHSKRIKITKNYQHDMSPVEIDKGQIEQVFINLFNNAADAIDNNGEIRIDVHTEEKNISVVNMGEIKYAAITITDTGSGIKPEDINNIFETFFTTKQEGKGTGLGLPISKAIILRHKGKIEVYSEPGKFTTFRIFLPVNNKGQSE
jgi:signal transduction histidine kinase